VTTTLPRCPFPGCPIRYRGGPNRECPEHQNEVLHAAADLGIDLLGSYGAPMPGASPADASPPEQ
jgi:hypothetical protein